MSKTRETAVHSRRKFLTQAGVLSASSFITSAAPAKIKTTVLSRSETVSLCGEWWFRTDSGNIGEAQHWFGANDTDSAWRAVRVPHTWQIEPGFEDYRGTAWYRRTFEAPREWKNSAVRIEFEAVFHTSKIWLNGQLAGEHVRKGYTAFVVDITHLLRWGQPNIIAVRVDNAFDEHMVPRGHSSDWAHDGGIYRSVQLLITPKIFVEHVDVESLPDLANGSGKLTITAHLKNTTSHSWVGGARFQVIDDETGQPVLEDSNAAVISVNSGAAQTSKFEATLPKVKLWHFDQPTCTSLFSPSAADKRTIK